MLESTLGGFLMAAHLKRLASARRLLMHYPTPGGHFVLFDYKAFGKKQFVRP